MNDQFFSVFQFQSQELEWESLSLDPERGHLCSLEKRSITVQPRMTHSLWAAHSERLWPQKLAPPNTTKMSLTCAKQPCRIEWRALITKVPFLPSFLRCFFLSKKNKKQKTPLHINSFSYLRRGPPSLSFTLPLTSWGLISAGRAPPSRHLHSLVLLSDFLFLRSSARPQNKLAASALSFIIDAFCTAHSIGVGVNFHSIEDVNRKCNSDDDATAVAVDVRFFCGVDVRTDRWQTDFQFFECCS